MVRETHSGCFKRAKHYRDTEQDQDLDERKRKKGREEGRQAGRQAGRQTRSDIQLSHLKKSE